MDSDDPPAPRPLMRLSTYCAREVRAAAGAPLLWNRIGACRPTTGPATEVRLVLACGVMAGSRPSRLNKGQPWEARHRQGGVVYIPLLASRIAAGAVCMADEQGKCP